MSRVVKILSEIELASRTDLLMAIEQASLNGGVSRYQRLAALVEIASSVSKMIGKTPDDVY
jgi:hypothetical protein